MGLRIEIVVPLVAIAYRRRLKATGGPFRVSKEVLHERQSLAREDGLDNTLAETFPCSDPLSSIPNPSS